MKILVLNAGSSSHKICLFELGETLPKEPPPCLWQAKIEWHGDVAGIEVKHPFRNPERKERKVSSHTEAVQDVVRTIWQGDNRIVNAPGEIDMVGHRIVHGGLRYEEPVQITAAVKDGIASVAAFAPLHNRAELQGIEAMETLFGNVSQVAVFDTGFHRRMPLPAVTYPGPYEWFMQDIRRYG